MKSINNVDILDEKCSSLKNEDPVAVDNKAGDEMPEYGCFSRYRRLWGQGHSLIWKHC